MLIQNISSAFYVASALNSTGYNYLTTVDNRYYYNGQDITDSPDKYYNLFYGNRYSIFDEANGETRVVNFESNSELINGHEYCVLTGCFVHSDQCDYVTRTCEVSHEKQRIEEHDFLTTFGVYEKEDSFCTIIADVCIGKNINPVGNIIKTDIYDKYFGYIFNGSIHVNGYEFELNLENIAGFELLSNGSAIVFVNSGPNLEIHALNIVPDTPLDEPYTAVHKTVFTPISHVVHYINENCPIVPAAKVHNVEQIEWTDTTLSLAYIVIGITGFILLWQLLLGI